MKSELCILAFSPTKVKRLNPVGLMAVGGQNGSGVIIEGLKEKDDYAIISVSEQGVVVHSLRGRHGALSLSSMVPLVIDDLTLVSFPYEFKDQAQDGFVLDFPARLPKILQSFAEPDDLTDALRNLLILVLEMAEMEKGLIITRDIHNEFSISVQHGVDPKDPWLSETLIQEAIRTKKPQIIQNIFGTGFESKKSLIATGFLSVFAWPLVVRGECVGVFMMGSRKPHSGIDGKIRELVEVLVQVAALFLAFHLRDKKIKEEVAALKRSSEFSDLPLLTNDKQLVETCRIARQIAPTDLSVLVQGETGIGKELLASWIHQKSDRAKKPFVVVNCGAIPSELLESLLFGHKKGAFTGAHADHTGKFQVADGGTLFLDEVGDLPEILQVKLLRVLQEKVVEPVGGNQPMKVNVRVLAATHKPMTELVAKGKFRKDLYYRLAEATLFIPSLRERPQDIVLLATSFLRQVSPEKRFSQGAWEWMKTQPWEGNVRELMSTVRRAALLSYSEEIQRNDFFKGAAGDSRTDSTQYDETTWLGGKDLEEAKLLFVRQKVQTALRMADGKRNKAAELLGIAPRTLFRYLEGFDSEMTDVSHTCN